MTAQTSQARLAPSDHPDVMGQEQIEQHKSAMSDLLALALSCDLTRVFSVLFSSAGPA